MAILEWQIAEAFNRELRHFAVEILVREGFASIVEQAEARGADLIVLGGTKKGRWKELFLGTTL